MTGQALAPGLGEELGGVELIAASREIWLAILEEVVAKEQSMIVRATVFVAVFPTVIETEFSDSVAETLREGLPVFHTESAIGGEMFFIIRKRDEGVGLVLRCFVHAAYSPLSRTFETAARTLAAGNRYGLVVVTLLLIEGDLACGRTVSRKRRVARHSEAYPAAHGALRHISAVDPQGPLSEVLAAGSSAHFSSPHLGFLRCVTDLGTYAFSRPGELLPDASVFRVPGGVRSLCTVSIKGANWLGVIHPLRLARDSPEFPGRPGRRPPGEPPRGQEVRQGRA